MKRNVRFSDFSIAFNVERLEDVNTVFNAHRNCIYSYSSSVCVNICRANSISYFKFIVLCAIFYILICCHWTCSIYTHPSLFARVWFQERSPAKQLFNIFVVFLFSVQKLCDMALLLLCFQSLNIMPYGSRTSSSSRTILIFLATKGSANLWNREIQTRIKQGMSVYV